MSQLDANAQATLTAFRTQAFYVATLLCALALLVIIGINIATGLYVAIPADLAASVLFAGAFAVQRRFGLEAGTYLLISAILTGATINAVLLGGLWHGTMAYIPLASVLAGLLAGIRPAIVAGIAGIGIYVGLLLCHAYGISDAPIVLPEGVTEVEFTIANRLPDQLAGHLVLTAVTVAFLLVQARGFQLWQQAADTADRAKKSQSRFFAGLSHELRTPLNGVIVALDLVEEQTLEGENVRMVQTARSSASVLLGLINDVLDFSRLEAGKVEIDAVPTDIGALVARTISPLALLGEEKGVSVDWTIGAEVPEWIAIDPRKVQQVLLNLSGNAVKFTERGSVRVDVAYETDTLVLSVHDTGIGLTEEQQGRMFRPFEQADASVSRRFGGTGLGLAIVAQLVELCDGTIHVTSTPGEGSTFTVRFPAADVPSPASSPSAAPSLHPPTLRVLLVDDNAVNRTVGRALLERDGHEVSLAEDGAQAVERVAAEAYDVVLMDIHMPEMNGYEATREIRRTGSAVTILALTASPDAEHRKQARDCGMNGLLGKPIRREELVAALDEVAAYVPGN